MLNTLSKTIIRAMSKKKKYEASLNIFSFKPKMILIINLSKINKTTNFLLKNLFKPVKIITKIKLVKIFNFS